MVTSWVLVSSLFVLVTRPLRAPPPPSPSILLPVRHLVTETVVMKVVLEVMVMVLLRMVVTSVMMALGGY